MPFMGPFNLAPTGFRFVIVLTDYYTKWLEVLHTDNTSAETIIDFLDSRFATWGLPASITTDNGPHFLSDVYKQFCMDRDIHRIFTPVYNRQAGGATGLSNNSSKH